MSGDEAKAYGGTWIVQVPFPPESHQCITPHVPYASELATGSVWRCRCGKEWELIRDQYAIYSFKEKA